MPVPPPLQQSLQHPLQPALPQSQAARLAPRSPDVSERGSEHGSQHGSQHAGQHEIEPSGTIPSLDGVRALAIALVFLAHSGLERIVPGGLGVTIFFVLSGYLITTLMRIEYRRTERIGFRAFYLRRLLRLMPPLVLVITVAGIFSLCGVIGGGFTTQGFLSALLYYGNYFDIVHDFNGIPAGLGVLWSLAIEEHYYLLYPPLALVLLGIGTRRGAPAVLAALCVAMLAWRYWLLGHGASEDYLTMATDTRADAILVGCIMGLWHNPRLDPVRPPHRARDGALAGAALFVLLATLVYRDVAFRLTLRYTLQAVAVAPLIYLAVARSGQWPYRWLNARPLVYLGAISYTIYLVHHVILLGVLRNGPALGWFGQTLVAALLTWAVAELMRRGVEEPCALWRRRLHQRLFVDARPDALAKATS